MPRKDLTEERTEQILDALERCVIRFGLGGTSLEQVAQEADMKRSILRHYVGNRDELIVAMAERLAERYRGQLQELFEYVGDSQRVERLLEYLFSPPTSGCTSDVVLVEALIAAAETNPEIRELMTSTIVETVNAVRDQLRLEFPNADSKSVWTVAYGVVGICFNHESLAALSMPRRYRQAALASSRRLIETLREE